MPNNAQWQYPLLPNIRPLVIASKPGYSLQPLNKNLNPYLKQLLAKLSHQKKNGFDRLQTDSIKLFYKELIQIHLIGACRN